MRIHKKQCTNKVCCAKACITRRLTRKRHRLHVVEYLMAYKFDGSASFVGYETVSGVLDEKSGSFVFEHRAQFKDGIVDSTWSIVEGSGTGALSGINGTVDFSAGHQKEYAITIDYEL